MYNKVRQHFNLGEQITWWDDEGHFNHGIVESPVQRRFKVDCVQVDGKWICLDAISIDGQPAKCRLEKVGRMIKQTGGHFGTWKLNEKIYKVSDWVYNTRRYIRYFNHQQENIRPAIIVYLKPRYHLVRVYKEDGELYYENECHQSLNDVGLIGCDKLREYFLEAIGYKGPYK